MIASPLLRLHALQERTSAHEIHKATAYRHRKKISFCSAALVMQRAVGLPKDCQGTAMHRRLPLLACRAGKKAQISPIHRKERKLLDVTSPAEFINSIIVLEGQNTDITMAVSPEKQTQV